MHSIKCFRKYRNATKLKSSSAMREQNQIKSSITLHNWNTGDNNAMQN